MIRRAEYLLKVNPPRPNACIHDCNYALNRNPDSAKGLKIRGKAYAYYLLLALMNRMLGMWLEAANDLRRACQFDFDESTDALRREVDEKAHKIEEQHRQNERMKAAEEERAKEERARAYRERVMRWVIEHRSDE